MRLILLNIFVILSLISPARAEPLELHIDADYSVSYAAAEAIELGVRTALEEANYEVGGFPVALIRKDHRGNVKRSYRNMQQFVRNERALLMIGGLHSPPYITHRDYMNENGILALLPWSAGAPITRAGPGLDNWIFRVSVDDSKSGSFFIQEALDRQGCNEVALVLLDTGWGRAGEKALIAALSERGRSPATVQFFPFSLGNAAAGTLADEVAAQNADCVVMMANAGNGAVVVKALHERVPGLRVFSHWGIMGSTFQAEVSHEIRAALNLRVLQTCALRVERNGSEILSDVLAQALPEAQSLAEIGAVTGFVHGYDMTRIMLAAADQIAQTDAWISGTIAERRAALKSALEHLNSTVDGILKTYERPFRPWTPTDTDSHEALGLNDLCMAQFREDGLLQDAN